MLLLLVGCATVESNNQLERELIREKQEVSKLKSQKANLTTEVEKVKKESGVRASVGLWTILIDLIF